MAFVLVDTNIWARRLERDSPSKPIARRALHELKARGDELVIVPQTLYELWVVTT
jgi:predicted nucleic acid-binding protein